MKIVVNQKGFNPKNVEIFIDDKEINGCFAFRYGVDVDNIPIVILAIYPHYFELNADVPVFKIDDYDALNKAFKEVVKNECEPGY